MTVRTEPEGTATRRDSVWHGRTAEEACSELGVDAATGLDSAEVEKRRVQYGPNKLAEAPKEPAGTRSCASTATSCSTSCSVPRS